MLSDMHNNSNFIKCTFSVLNYSSELLHTYSLVLHSTCAESASEPDTTLQLMWCHIIQQCITKKPVRAHIRLNVDFGIGDGAQDTALFTTNGKYLVIMAMHICTSYHNESNHYQCSD